MKRDNAWGKECRCQMIRKDMTLNDLAEATGYTRTYLSAIINGRVLVPAETMEKISRTLGVDDKLLDIKYILKY